MAKPRNVIDGVTRLAQMHETTRAQLEALDIEWNRIYKLAVTELGQIKIGLDDIASMLGIIEPQREMPMLPPRVGTGPQPTFTSQADEFGAGNSTDLDRYQP